MCSDANAPGELTRTALWAHRPLTLFIFWGGRDIDILNPSCLARFWFGDTPGPHYSSVFGSCTLYQSIAGAIGAVIRRIDDYPIGYSFLHITGAAATPVAGSAKMGARFFCCAGHRTPKTSGNGDVQVASSRKTSSSQCEQRNTRPLPRTLIGRGFLPHR